MKFSGSSIITAMRNSLAGRFELRCLRRWAHRVMILNPGMAEEAIVAGLDPNQLLWMPNPVDTVAFAPCGPDQRREARAELGIEPDARIVLFVGRLAPEKELASLLAGFSLIVPCISRALLVLVGEGPSRNELEARAGEGHLSSRVRFTGRQTAAEVHRWLQVSDVFALVSSNEGLSCSLLEAMSTGLPSVVSDIPANAQLIDSGTQGLRIATGDHEAIAQALAKLLGDDALRKRMGAAARQRVLENYSTCRVVERYEALFHEALADDD
jgi:glycosyltransferase involved in cell wall biosynthesis